MPSNKRRIEFFDPNKSDSEDENFAPGQERSPRKPSRKSTVRSSGKSGGHKRKRTKYQGSDVDDDDLDLSEEDLSFSGKSEEEDEEMNPITGRRQRQATRNPVNYIDSDDNVTTDLNTDNSDDGETRQAKRRKLVKLKLPAGSTVLDPPTRSTRAGSAARTAQAGTAAIRRGTRATTQDADDLVEFSTSGNHIIRGTRSPEPIPGRRATRGGKGLKQPSTSIVEEVHETSSQELIDIEAGAADTNMTAPNDAIQAAKDDADDDEDELASDAPIVQSGLVAAALEAEDEDEDDIAPVSRRSLRGSRTSISAPVPDSQEEPVVPARSGRLTRGGASRAATAAEPSSDFEPPEESAEEEISASESSPQKGKGVDDDYDSSPRRGRGSQGKGKNSRSRRRGSQSDSEDEIDPDELADEAAELRPSRRRRPMLKDSDIVYETKGPRNRKPVDYTIKPMDAIYAADEDAEEEAVAPVRRNRGGKGTASQPWERNLHTAYGPFGGAGGAGAVIGGPWGTGATGGVDSDSSEDEGMQRPIGGAVGLTPTAAGMPGLLPGLGQTNNPTEPGNAVGGTPANFGRVKSQKALADADPLGVDQNVDFSKVGGLAGHIDQLKEMVQMPLLYPELFLKFHVTPPRGVLFHGPPGTGKTLLARALAASVGSGGRKITFYMRKGADALSKWVGEAERQLRLLFEEARKTQPSIIFFDEIDGLAPVRSSKQEQIHASIVSTLLALMDGMDGRGQVIVIGATNRPDNIDPALRRPGRFDREFYFPLPDVEARKSIINIHTRDWGIDDKFKDNLANATKGYGGADLRALCTEAALNSIQRTYPQIYQSNEKLIVDPDKITVTAKDFMLSIKKMVPSSERATSSGAVPLPKVVEPLLREQLQSIEHILDGLIPIKKKTTALQEAMYEQYNDADQGFGRETLQQEFEKARVFRPRLLIGGLPGMGQSYLGAALLNHFEGLHVQNFDLPTIYADSTRSAETAIVQLFAEVKRHKPSVIYLPAIDTWYHTLSDAVITTFMGLLRSIPPTDPVLVLGICDAEPDKMSQDMLRDMFGFSQKNQFLIQRPSKANREEFFRNIVNYIKTAPKDFPDPAKRKLRKLETLQVAPPPPPRVPTKEEIKALKKRDHQLLNTLKVAIQPIMDQIQRKYRKFRNPVIPQSQIQYLYDEQDPDFVRPDVVQFRPFELETDKDGVKGLRETATGKFFYNMETTTIEERLANGYYCRPKDFLFDIKTLAKDARNFGDRDRVIRANELLTNCEVDVANIEAAPAMAECENVYQRQLQRTKDKEDKARKRAEARASPFPPADSLIVEAGDSIQLGPPPSRHGPLFSTPFQTPSSASNRNSGGLSNGDSEQLTNGSSIPSKTAGQDVAMGGTDYSQQDSPAFNSQVMPPPLSQWRSLNRGPSNISSQGISQNSGFMPLPHGVSPTSMINDASTTTSGRDNSDKRTSDGNNTQLTNGQQYSPTEDQFRDSQIPDTQREPVESGSTQISSGDKEWPHSQAHGLARGQILPGYHTQTPSSESQGVSQPPVHPTNQEAEAAGLPAKPATAVETTAPSQPTSSVDSSQKELIIDFPQIEELFEGLVRKSSGCSIEQLEQINRELMTCLWDHRGEWNRAVVVNKLREVFNETISDIESMQRILKPSQEESQVSHGETQLRGTQYFMH